MITQRRYMRIQKRICAKNQKRRSMKIPHRGCKKIQQGIYNWNQCLLIIKNSLLISTFVQCQSVRTKCDMLYKHIHNTYKQPYIDITRYVYNIILYKLTINQSVGSVSFCYYPGFRDWWTMITLAFRWI